MVSTHHVDAQEGVKWYIGHMDNQQCVPLDRINLDNMTIGDANSGTVRTPQEFAKRLSSKNIPIQRSISTSKNVPMIVYTVKLAPNNLVDFVFFSDQGFCEYVKFAHA
jgi:hypothetical protein